MRVLTGPLAKVIGGRARIEFEDAEPPDAVYVDNDTGEEVEVVDPWQR